MLVEGTFTWKRCPVALCLASLFLLGVFQSTPLPASLLQRLSPVTAELRERLLPGEHEVVSTETPQESPPPATISLCYGATRASLVRFLAVFALFAAVRNNIASPESLRRLAVAAVFNGVLLSLFAVAQFLTAPHHEVYWRFASQGQVFGPFICRNHFPYYVNQCIGLGVGLLLCRGLRHGPATSTGLLSIRGILDDALAPWICISLALMVAAVAFSLSRGGALALLGAASVCFVVRRLYSARGPGFGVGMLLAALSVGLVAWLGFELVERRLSTLWQGSLLQEDRFRLWGRVLPLSVNFPLWGTGYGTFPYVEPLRRGPTDVLNMTYDHAHNDYVEALVEGGAVMLALLVGAMVLTCRRGVQAMQRGMDSPNAGLAAGCILSLAAVSLHSLGDFGLHVPAVTLLLAVTAAQLCGLGDGQCPTRETETPLAHSVGIRGLGPVLGAAAAIVVGLVMVDVGRRQERAERYRLAARRCGQKQDTSSQDRRLAYLAAATTILPDDAALRVSYAEALHQRYQKRGANRDSLALALVEFIRARDLCPLLVEPNMRLAGHTAELSRADRPIDYLRRAQYLAPNDPRLWYISGLEELAAGRLDQAWQAWRQSLLCSDEYLDEIIVRSAARFRPEAIVEYVVPANPQQLLAAARCYERATSADARPFLARALAIVDGTDAPYGGVTMHLKAQAHVMLHQHREARGAYEAALALEPQRTLWRFELARLMAKDGLLEEARRELLAVLQQEPGHAEARDLYLTVVHDIAAADR
jgi:O-antigen ligase/tetratricopeptide (TPR) repeat protein